jgi:16S rRNA (uracil1498-N3)-methyltransferase
VLHEGAQRPVGAVVPPTDGDIVMVVGPEGGLTEAEVASLVSAGALAVRIGPTVLRSSTAGAVGAATLLSRTPRWAATP